MKICDRCHKRKLGPVKAVEVIHFTNTDEKMDLCKTCFEDLKDFVFKTVVEELVVEEKVEVEIKEEPIPPIPKEPYPKKELSKKERKEDRKCRIISMEPETA